MAVDIQIVPFDIVAGPTIGSVDLKDVASFDGDILVDGHYQVSFMSFSTLTLRLCLHISFTFPSLSDKL